MKKQFFINAGLVLGLAIFNQGCGKKKSKSSSPAPAPQAQQTTETGNPSANATGTTTTPDTTPAATTEVIAEVLPNEHGGTSIGDVIDGQNEDQSKGKGKHPKGKPGQNPGQTWTDDQRQSLINSCAVDTDLPEPKIVYCICWVNSMEQNHPNYVEFEQISQKDRNPKQGVSQGEPMNCVESSLKELELQ